MSAVVDSHGHGHGHDHHDHHGGYGGLMRWVTTTNHKDIGTMYLWFSFIMFMVGGAMAMAIRLELFQPGIQFFNPDLFNQFTTMHGLIMVFGAIMPAFVGFANWQIPMMIGAPDMAFARLNNWSFWLLPFAASLLVISFFTPGGAPGVGWTLYAPLTVQMGVGMDLTIFAVHLLGMSSILGSINIITTILNMRAPGHDADAHAAVLLDLADHRLPAGGGDAGAGGRGDHVAHRPPFRHLVLQRRGRRRPGAVPAHLLVLRPSRGLHHRAARLRRGLAGDPGVLEEAAVRLRLDGLRHLGDRDPVVHRLGAPHVHGRACRCRGSCSSCTRPR